MTHTPGPWKTELPTLDGFKHHLAITGGTWKQLATVVDHMDGEISAEGTANARLIAAAPELLEALKSAEWWLENTGGLADLNSDVLAEIKAAIAKAEGN